MSAEEFRKLRKRTLDVAFPVSRERVRRSGLLNSVRKLPSFAQVSETQIVQVAINLMISSELVPGDRHYRQVSRDLPKEIWDHVARRFETASGDLKPSDQEAALVARQIELDVRYVMIQRGVATVGKGFAELQEEFRLKGYIDE